MGKEIVHKEAFSVRIFRILKASLCFLKASSASVGREDEVIYDFVFTALHFLKGQ